MALRRALEARQAAPDAATVHQEPAEDPREPTGRAHVTQDLDATFDVTFAECGAGPILAGGAERERSLRLIARVLAVRQFRRKGNFAAHTDFLDARPLRFLVAYPAAPEARVGGFVDDGGGEQFLCRRFGKAIAGVDLASVSFVFEDCDARGQQKNPDALEVAEQPVVTNSVVA